MFSTSISGGFTASGRSVGPSDTAIRCSLYGRNVGTGPDSRAHTVAVIRFVNVLLGLRMIPINNILEVTFLQGSKFVLRRVKNKLHHNLTSKVHVLISYLKMPFRHKTLLKIRLLKQFRVNYF